MHYYIKKINILCGLYDPSNLKSTSYLLSRMKFPESLGDAIVQSKIFVDLTLHAIDQVLRLEK